jgi:hypothetical protein
LFYASLLKIVETSICAVLQPEEFSLCSYTIDYQGNRQVISQECSLSESVILLSGRHIIENSVNYDCARLIFKSPMRLPNNGSIMNYFDFDIFFRSQLRRCSSLFSYYGSGELWLDFSDLSETAKYVAVLEDEIHYTRPQWSRRKDRSGLTGSVECAGLVEPMFSLLLLGSYFNAGKGATFGAGRYQIEVL